MKRVLAALALVGLVAGCAVPAHVSAPAPVPELSARVQAPVGVARAVPSSTTSIRSRWATSFTALQRDLSGPAGVSVVGVGHPGAITVGRYRTGVAWSTSKVPLSVAALRRSHSTTTRSLVKRAITVSDNAAAERLWSRLGTPKKAAARVQRVVRDSGDRDTKVQDKRVRAGFTAFGQTTWALDDQARFAAGLACRREARPVLTLMGKITKSQRWGLGHARRARFKGGWGPVKRGYLVRQVGVVTMPDGRTYGVSIAVYSPKGFSRGTKDLTRIARWLDKRLAQVPAGRC